MFQSQGYEIIEVLYSGANTRVFRVNKNNKSFILKTLNSDYPEQRDINAIKTEFEILSGLNSARIIKAIGLEEYKNSIAIVLEDIGGEAVSSFLKKSESITFSEILKIMIQITKAVSEIHKANLVHKDIKMENMIFNSKTSELQIIDFGNASILIKQNTFIPLNSSIEGTLAYISPEQTGRMNRSIDYRTDFYSLGIAFYQMLTRRLPFSYSDPMGMVHAHIAKMPTPPIDIWNLDMGQLGSRQKLTMQKALSDITMKLLQKNPEDRYQSANGILYDLEWCLNHFVMEHHEDNYGYFKIATHDFSEKFQIPEKLYGRTKEILRIVKAFDRVSEGNTELFLISGKSGIGKSALINEINKPLVEHRGYFSFGKYDPYKKSIPYSALTQSFQGLIRQILMEDEKSIATWKEKILVDLGKNAKIILDVIPELEALIGVQPDVIELPATESQNRFNLVFQTFIKAFCAKEHPIALFLDDLQWADSSSLSLIFTILSNPEMKYLFLILSFRDNEVLPSDPLAIMLENLKKTEIVYKEILLEPLSEFDITNMVTDTLGCNEKKGEELAIILKEKTKGNPFFVNEMFRSLYDKGYIYYSEGVWSWDIKQIRQIKISENVIDLMIEKIKELPETSIRLMTLAACIGDGFQIELLSEILRQTSEEVTRELEAMANEGLFILKETMVEFVHDKVREATYTFLSPEEKAKNHYLIGSIYLKNVPKDKLEDQVFSIVNQLNHGIIFIKKEERERLLDLNVFAGNQAFASAAYEAALEFYKVAISLLGDDSWENNYDLTLSLYSSKANAEYFITQFAEATKTYEIVYKNARQLLDKIPIVSIQLRQQLTQGRGVEAFEIGFAFLTELDLKLPNPSNPNEVKQCFLEQLERNKELLGDRKISELYDLPEMQDLKIKSALQIITNLGDIAIVLRPDMLGLISILGVNLSIQYGNRIESSISYVMWGVIRNLVFRDYNSGYDLGQLSIKLNQEKFPSDLIFGKVHAFYGWNIHHWLHHVKEDIAISQKGYEVSMANSDLTYASYFIIMAVKSSFFIGLILEDIIAYSKLAMSFGEKYKMPFINCITLASLQFSLAMQGKTKSLTSFETETFQDKTHLDEYASIHQGIAYYYLRKFQLLFYANDYAGCLEIFPDVEKYFLNIPQHIAFCEFHFFTALTFLILMPSFSSEQKEIYSQKIQISCDYLKLWAELCEVNFLHKLLLIQAESARLQNKVLEAIDLYDAAISYALKGEYINDAALANELAGIFFSSIAKPKLAVTYIRESYYYYSKWEAKAKVKQLEEKFPELKKFSNSKSGNFELESLVDSTLISSKNITGGHFLDLDSVLKASQAISGEIHLGRLLEKMLKILFENAGAERGFFILKKGERWYIEAEGNSSSNAMEVLQAKPLEEDANLSTNIVNYVIRTKGIVLLSDASNKGLFINYSYIKKNKPKSILCYPIINRSILIGVVYLENNLTTDAFTSDRVEILKVLSSQIAVSVENSLLYSSLEEKVEERTKQVNEMLDQIGKLYLDSENKRKEIEGLAESRKRLSIVGQMAAGIVHDIKNPMATIKAMAEMLSDDSLSQESKEEYLKLILHEMDRLNDLAYEILDFSKGKLNLNLEELNLEEFILEVSEFLKMNFQYVGIEFSLDLQYKENILIDKDRMRRVIVNLCNNAIEAMSDGKKEYRFKICSERKEISKEKYSVILSLIDNGHGIPGSVQEKIFQAFATDGKAKGTGLGLFMSKWIVEAHNGEFSYETQEGEGTVFFITLPGNN